MAEIEVPTIRTDTRYAWVSTAIIIVDLLLISRRMSGPVRVGAFVLGFLVVAVTIVMRRLTSRHRPPVQITPDGLRLPDSAADLIEIDWPDIARVTFRRRLLLPHLIVEPVNPDRLRPAPDRWRRAAATGRRGYRLDVALGGDRASRARLREEIAARVSAA